MKITPAQINYIECLGIDLGFSPAQLKNFIQLRTRPEVKFLDELNSFEARKVITILLERKNSNKSEEKDDRD